VTEKAQRAVERVEQYIRAFTSGGYRDSFIEALETLVEEARIYSEQALRMERTIHSLVKDRELDLKRAMRTVMALAGEGREAGQGDALETSR
jgi:hypothetical protein